ncbi:TM0996/MTH895 family glutaredoxin-like protein [bacterium]|nr:TM0996/MTH895 family glutaredoxin-like protein [bacterium]
MKIEILGTGCPKCRQLEKNVNDAVAETGITAEVVKITKINEIMGYGVMVTPALVIDGKIISTGKVIGTDDIKKLIT